MRIKGRALLGMIAVAGALTLCGYAATARQDVSLKDAIQLGKAEKYAEAIEAAKQVIQQQKGAEKKQPHTFLGIMYFKTKQYDNALGEFMYTLTLDKNSPMAYYFLGLTYEAKAVECSDRNISRALKTKALDSWQNYLQCSRNSKKPVSSHHRNLGISIEKSRESAEKHIQTLKEELTDEKN